MSGCGSDTQHQKNHLTEPPGAGGLLVHFLIVSAMRRPSLPRSRIASVALPLCGREFLFVGPSYAGLSLQDAGMVANGSPGGRTIRQLWFWGARCHLQCGQSMWQCRPDATAALRTRPQPLLAHPSNIFPCQDLQFLMCAGAGLLSEFGWGSSWWWGGKC